MYLKNSFADFISKILLKNSSSILVIRFFLSVYWVLMRSNAIIKQNIPPKIDEVIRLLNKSCTKPVKARPIQEAKRAKKYFTYSKLYHSLKVFPLCQLLQQNSFGIFFGKQNILNLFDLTLDFDRFFQTNHIQWLEMNLIF